MRIGCLGLSANPPHKGHRAFARALLKSGYVDEVWLIPMFQHPFLKSDFANVDHRLLMCKMLEEPGVRVCAVEIERGGISYTIDTLKYLQKKYPQNVFYWCVGSDIITSKSYRGWHKWNELARLVKFLVVGRPGYLVSRKALLKCFILVGRVEGNDVSSTDIRKMAREGKDIKPYVGAKIAQYIKKHKLYEGREE